MTTTIVFAGKLPGNNGKGGLLRMHHRTKTKYKNFFHYVSRSQTKNSHPGPVKLTLIRYSAGVPMDFDNLVSTGKLPVDGIVSAGIIKDDKNAIIQQREYLQEKCKVKDQKTVIIITDITP